MKNKIFTIGKKILIFISFFLFYIILYNSFDIIFNYENVNTKNIIELLIYFITCIYLFILYKKNIIQDFKMFLKNWRKLFKNNFSIFIFSLLMMYISNVILFTQIGSIASNEALSREAISSNAISSIVTMCIFAPFYEEVLFRLNFRDLFNNKYVYIITVGILFGSMHLLSIQSVLEALYIIPYSVMGIGFALMYYNTNNIFTSIMFHMLNNSAVIFILFLGGNL